MHVQALSNDAQIPQDTGENSVHEVFLSATDHPFWDQQSVPKPDSEVFQRWISGTCEGAEKLPVQIFSPKDQHCGIWQSPPNKACHASFGDQGTTASTNCYGNVIQITQYLGAGRSGFFSMDQVSTEEPYFVCVRANDLEDLVKDTGRWLSYDLKIPDEFFPQEPLNVKWVNWRWPRYEYDPDVTGTKASAQWTVHKGIVLKQLVIENATNEEIEFNFSFTKDMLIRDLDYLDSRYHFNDSHEGYSYVPGPNKFGYVCVHTLEPQVKPESDERDMNGRASQDPGATPNVQVYNSPEGLPITSSTANNQSVKPDFEVTEQTNDPSMNAQPIPPMFAEQAKVKAEDSHERGPHTKKSHAVASVITIFVNGKAIMTQGSSGSHTFTLPGKESGSAHPYSPTLELVVAYKMILLPNVPIDWRNFLVSSDEADVNTILQRETDLLWDPSDNFQLSSLGISLVDVEPEIQNQTLVSKVADTQSTNNSPNKRTNQGTRNSQAATGFGTSNEHISTTMDEQRRTQKLEIPPLITTKMAESPTGIPNKTSSKNHIEYLMWRHLEHILSVCAAPLSTPALFEDAERPTSSPAGPSTLKEATPVALTCGDMAGHRICTSASFFAFKFLVDVARRLNSCGKNNLYTQSLQRRIKFVCQGHITWLKLLRSPPSLEPRESQKRLLKSGCFAANYWATGFIMPDESSTWQPNDTVTDTPFQILKITDYFHICDNDDEIKEIHELLQDIWIPWLLNLDMLDCRSSYAWPHAFHEDVNIFRLDDHVWVWRALKSLEERGLWKTLPSTKSIEEGKYTQTKAYHWIFQTYRQDGDQLSEEEEVFGKFAKVAKRLYPLEVQRNALMRFTTENDLDVSRKRMLAVTRSPRETRFLLHSRDTSLFYGEDLEFFLPNSPYHDLWENTLEAQVHHDENKETTWDNAIRYALGVVVGTRGSSLNNKAPTELVRTCVEVLIRSSSHAGFLPGQLDETTKEPRLFYQEEDANFYYHAGFEVNHILLTHARRIDEAFHKVASYNSRRLRRSATEPFMENHDRARENSVLAEILASLTTQPKRQRPNDQGQQNPGIALTQLGIATGLDARRSFTMKKLIPFNNLIDVSSINALEDEWLYNYPQFLMMKDVDLEELADSNKEAAGGMNDQDLQLPRNPPAQKRHDPSSLLLEAATFIADTPKQKHLGKREKRALQSETPQSLNNFELRNKLMVHRTATRAKKRFIWLPRANNETASLCRLVSPEPERSAMLLFFDRHSRYEKYVWDDTTMVVNTWQTEVHLSFYEIVATARSTALGLPPLSKDPFPGASKKELRRASMGFRFDGDFFDRYWTCHYIEHTDARGTRKDLKWDFPFESSRIHAQKQWWQRKVLELHLLHRMLKSATFSSLQILNEVRSELGIVNSTISFSILDSDAYFSTKENWQGFEYILQAVDEDLTAVLRTLEKWDRREAERGQEKPRWTRNDERKYRGVISKLQGSTEREMRDLESHRNNIRKLKETLTTSRERIRDDRELHRNENIRYFTYVTVIFLPLGFASSFYSMNGAPQYNLMISLIKFSIAAFAVTVGLLASAKVIFGAVDIILMPLRNLRKRAELTLEKSSRTKRKESLLHGNPKEQAAGVVEQEQPPKALAEESTEDHGQVFQPKRSAQRVSSSPSSFWFWLSYIFFEIPGLKVLTAFAALERETLSASTVVDIVLGIVFLPIFGFAWLSEFIFLNFQDFFGLLNHVRHSIWSAMFRGTSNDERNAPNTSDGIDATVRRRFERLSEALDSVRPFKGLEERLDKRVEKRSKADSQSQQITKPAQGFDKEEDDARISNEN